MSMPPDRPDSAKKTRNSDLTRGRLIRAGRKLFADVGYADAHTQTIVAMSGKTRGALYHHFGNKTGLFRAVFEQMQDEIIAEVVAVARGDLTPIERIRAGFHAYLDACAREEFARIVLLDGPAVLGWSTWHEIDQRHAFALTRLLIEQAMAAKEIAEAPVEAMTRVLLGAVTQASLEIGSADDPAVARREIGEVVDLILTRLALRPE